MAKRWWQYKKRPHSQVLRVTAHLWVVFTITIVVATWAARADLAVAIGAGSSSLAIAGYFYRRAQVAERSEARKPEASPTR